MVILTSLKMSQHQDSCYRRYGLVGNELFRVCEQYPGLDNWQENEPVWLSLSAIIDT